MRKSPFLAAIAFALAAFIAASASARPVKKPIDRCRTVLGTWRITSLGLPWTYDVHADGTAIVDGGNPMTWTCAGNVVTFRNALGANVKVTVSSDGSHLSGTMTDGMPASGVRIGAPPSANVAAGTRAMRDKGVKSVGVPGKGSARERYCASKWVIWRDNWLRIYDEEFNIDDEPMPPEAIESNRRQFTARCMAGDEPTLDGDL
jgi:hypothetical protein